MAPKLASFGLCSFFHLAPAEKFCIDLNPLPSVVLARAAKGISFQVFINLFICGSCEQVAEYAAWLSNFTLFSHLCNFNELCFRYFFQKCFVFFNSAYEKFASVFIFL